MIKSRQGQERLALFSEWYPPACSQAEMVRQRSKALRGWRAFFWCVGLFVTFQVPYVNSSLSSLALRMWPQRQQAKTMALVTDVSHTPRALLAVPAFARGEVYSIVPVKPGSKVIALSFDDGPSAENTQRILELLKVEKVRATFYMVGRQVKALPHLARAVNAAGHDIGNHSWSHAAKPAHPAEEVRQTSKIIQQTVGVTTTHFRPPMGIMNNGVVQQAIRQKQAVTLWSCDPNDWKNTSTGHIVKTVTSQARPGGIVLLHDGGGDRSNTIAALPVIIRTLRAQGYRFVTISQLLHMQHPRS